MVSWLAALRTLIAFAPSLALVVAAEIWMSRILERLNAEIMSGRSDCNNDRFFYSLSDIGTNAFITLFLFSVATETWAVIVLKNASPIWCRILAVLGRRLVFFYPIWFAAALPLVGLIIFGLPILGLWAWFSRHIPPWKETVAYRRLDFWIHAVLINVIIAEAYAIGFRCGFV